MLSWAALGAWEEGVPASPLWEGDYHLMGQAPLGLRFQHKEGHFLPLLFPRLHSWLAPAPRIFLTSIQCIHPVPRDETASAKDLY